MNPAVNMNGEFNGAAAIDEIVDLIPKELRDLVGNNEQQNIPAPAPKQAKPKAQAQTQIQPKAKPSMFTAPKAEPKQEAKSTQDPEPQPEVVDRKSVV